MSGELEIFKQNRIREATVLLQTQIARLNSQLASAIRQVQQSRITMQRKQQSIRTLQTQHAQQVRSLQTRYDVLVRGIQTFVSPFQILIPPARKKALLVGINYANTPYALSGCVNDVKRMQTWLSSRGFECQLLVEEPSTTKASILQAFTSLVQSATAGDLLFFYYSGHGSYTFDKNGDETDGRDETVIASDLQEVVDDDFKRILSTHLKEKVTLVGMFDSCHSGTMLDLKFTYMDSTHYDAFTENDKTSECKGNVLMISGCADSQTSAEAWIGQEVQGAMTWCFLNTLQERPTSTWRELLVSMRDALREASYTQIPQLTTDSFFNIDSTVFL